MQGFAIGCNVTIIKPKIIGSNGIYVIIGAFYADHKFPFLKHRNIISAFFVSATYNLLCVFHQSCLISSTLIIQFSLF